jgi:hypothetical protein
LHIARTVSLTSLILTIGTKILNKKNPQAIAQGLVKRLRLVRFYCSKAL